MTRTINGHAVNPIGLGCMSLSWAYGIPPSPEDGAILLNRALDIGYNHLDTARIYGVGKNETLIGEALKGRRKEFFLASKTGIIVDGEKRRIDCRPATIRAALEESLKLLQTDHIDLYYLHRRDFNTPIEDSIGELADAVKAGKIGSIGLSEMSADTLRKASAVHPIAAMQTEYSPQTRNPEIAVLEACRELGTTFVAFSPVGRGSLCGVLRDPTTLPDGDLRKTWPRFTAENWKYNLALIDAFALIAADIGATSAQLALGWVLAKGDHIVTIPGTASIAHLEENIARHDWQPDAETIARVDALINQDSVAGSRYPTAQQQTIDTEEFA
ncbi:aldo/keto reductase [Sphingomonas paeninsulae]|jgi:aryl-alcohol dehydrogenase-like predicted oxidoreductase|uniref:Aldo/keto reductase n=1 Tax=Sphingomonas paeninsulae TaxID=2319844 RepID=A0A494TI29_SPHPE|nr:aldo/keto reductase [Sphingomonas paeninsulae]AYJ86982.1 aldo/keto reductase [Sphingomonas paeninsulae]